MAEITVKLTDKQEEFLKLFASKQFEGSRDNVGTNNPLHLVQTQDERVVDPDHEDPDKVSYRVLDSGADYDSIEELIAGYWGNCSSVCPIEIVSFDEAYRADEFIDVNGEEQVIMDEDDYMEAYGITKDLYYKTNIVFDYRTVAVFFILDEAKK